MLRSPIILIAIPAGLAAGFLAWLTAGGASATVTKLNPAEARVAALKRPRPSDYFLPTADVAQLTATPIFIMTTGPGAVQEPSLRLDGVVRNRSRVAALLSINGRPAEWLSVGESRDDVTLQDVFGSKVVVETLFGVQDVILGEEPTNTSPVGASSASASAPQQMAANPVLPGYRPPMPPPPPTSAPGRR